MKPRGVNQTLPIRLPPQHSLAREAADVPELNLVLRPPAPRHEQVPVRVERVRADVDAEHRARAVPTAQIPHPDRIVPPRRKQDVRIRRTEQQRKDPVRMARMLHAELVGAPELLDNLVRREIVDSNRLVEASGRKSVGNVHRKDLIVLFLQCPTNLRLVGRPFADESIRRDGNQGFRDFRIETE